MDVPVGHPSFGKAIPCRCRQRDDDPSRLAQLQRYSNLGPLTRITFDATRPGGRSARPGDQEMFRQAFEGALAFAEDPRGWLVLGGPSGSGKTHLAAAVVNRALEKGQHAFFMFVPDLLDHLRSTFTPDSEVPYDQLFEQVRNAPLLVLDDLGGHSSTPWAQEKLYQIVNHRYVGQLPTVFTLGLPMEELDLRLQTRLSDPDISTVCLLGGAGQAGAPDRWGTVEARLLRRMTFDTFDIRGNGASNQQRQSLEVALAYAQNFARSPEGWLVFFGPTGCGKTHLSVAIVNERIRSGQGVLYFLVADLLDYLRDTFSPDSKVTYDRRFEQVRNAPLLVLRDFGAYHATPWAREKLYQILVYRHDAFLPTIITTRELDEEGRADPVISRLLDTTLVSVIPIDAPDYRYRGRGRSPTPGTS
ncbi:MAG: ATP-binding protein [Chloroflexi bacterium]|nr:ATP-binding protein [Chloroflexota bacterium]